MKKLFILIALFVISVAIALGLVIQEMQRSKGSSVPEQGQNTRENPTPVEQTAVVPTVLPATTEGNIQLTILSPQNNTTTKETSVTIQGKTSPGASVMVNEFELKAGGDGSFSKTIPLDDGENYFSIVAFTDKGDVAEKEIVLIREVQGY